MERFGFDGGPEEGSWCDCEDHKGDQEKGGVCCAVEDAEERDAEWEYMAWSAPPPLRYVAQEGVEREVGWWHLAGSGGSGGSSGWFGDVYVPV